MNTALKKNMSNYNRNNRSGGGRFSGGRSGGGGGDYRRRDSGPRQMHRAVCDECGNDCEVPFRPSGDKPIYCSSCFEKRNGGDSARPTRRGGGGAPRGDSGNKQLLEQMSSLNSKVDRILKVIEKTTDKKPVFKKNKVKKETKKATPKVEKEAKKAVPKAKKSKTKKTSKKKASKTASK